MVAGQPGKQSACVGDDTRTLAATGSQQPPMEYRRKNRSRPSGVENIAFTLIFPHVFLFVLGRILSNE